MTPTTTILSPAETEAVMTGHRWGQSSVIAGIADDLLKVVDTDSSVFAAGINESAVNALRTKMQRLGYKLITRKVDRSGTKGYVLVAKSA